MHFMNMAFVKIGLRHSNTSKITFEVKLVSLIIIEINVLKNSAINAMWKLMFTYEIY